MSSIRDRMNKLRGLSENNGPVEQTEEAVTLAPADDAEELGSSWEPLGVRLLQNDWGSFLIRRREYPLPYRHGHHQLSDLHLYASGLNAFHPGQPAISAGQILFLDLETTGLGVGTGNVPFMTGIAYVEKDSFVIEQLLIRHPAEERAMLAHLKQRVERHSYLATYNGRTFDWPVLAGRYIMNGLGRTMADPKHLDFLHPSRSIWRNTLASCRLSHVEEERLGIFRVNDLPGSEAPARYFRFLSDNDPEPLAEVFTHNELDMLALACLAVRFGLLLGGGLGTALEYPEGSEELLRTGLWLERMGMKEEAERLFDRLTNRDPSPSWCLPLAARDKKCGNWQRAVLLWQKAANSAEQSQLPVNEAHIELAMYFEHRSKDYERALHYTEHALELAMKRLSLYRNDPKRRSEVDAIRKRMERLRRKAGRYHA
ncbi:hypothetical protein DNH61_23900 [Paenibacillus sambharensis]|uniref:YprB ribonuclease H-like domain-containing protein n=1 Tax=Paenibacillus sambharensis TaxID=1803190 RepID=A0A2W1L6C3_9BACL|nr:ribonuclease H-like domain-containing protein [Paenibacillus sambharensis]PZD93660.1 hypothetical protein DNH61_23900 [Paenibacillus sambharensis]